MAYFTIPSLTDAQSRKIANLLQLRLSTCNDLHVILEYVQWNVLGPKFIGVHETLDPQVEFVRGYADPVAERIAALGRSLQ
ncbi:DNA-binding ferritin-like protein [Mycobacteroides chelonae]|nr:DNA-binding ferritin-like protein [Mycobacteroides chelonae]